MLCRQLGCEKGPLRIVDLAQRTDPIRSLLNLGRVCFLPSAPLTRLEFIVNLACRLRRRLLAFRAACSDEGYGKSERRRVPPGKTQHASPASCAVTPGEFHRTRGRALDYYQGVGNNLQAGGYSGRFGFHPRYNGIKADVEQIGFGTMRKTELGHGLTRRRRKVELLTDTFKNIALDNAAGVAFVDCVPQRA
jgi:hypothetical protein